MMRKCLVRFLGEEDTATYASLPDNAAIANRKTQWKYYKYSVAYVEQQNCLPQFKEIWTEFKPLGSHALQATLKRVDLAFNRFFKGLSGYPRFKASRRYHGWTYPDIAGWKVESNGKNGHLNISNLGRIKIRGKARNWGKPNTCTIFFRNGFWYASFTVICTPERRSTGTGAVGMDLGCETAITLWDGEIATEIDNPRFLGKTFNS